MAEKKVVSSEKLGRLEESPKTRYPFEKLNTKRYAKLIVAILFVFALTTAGYLLSHSGQTEQTDWKTFNGESAYEHRTKFSVKYPPSCSLTEDKSNYFVGEDIISCMNGKIRIDPQAGGRGAFVYSSDTVKINDMTWERRLLGRGKVSGASYSFGEKPTALFEISYVDYTLADQELVEKIISTIKLTQ